MIRENRTVWKKLMEMASAGDHHAMKLYYEQLDKKRRVEEGNASSGSRDAPGITDMGGIREAVFGSAAMAADLSRAVSAAEENRGLVSNISTDTDGGTAGDDLGAETEDEDDGAD